MAAFYVVSSFEEFAHAPVALFATMDEARKYVVDALVWAEEVEEERDHDPIGDVPLVTIFVDGEPQFMISGPVEVK